MGTFSAILDAAFLRKHFDNLVAPVRSFRPLPVIDWGSWTGSASDAVSALLDDSVELHCEPKFFTMINHCLQVCGVGSWGRSMRAPQHLSP
jgi:hypothetical protein